MNRITSLAAAVTGTVSVAVVALSLRNKRPVFPADVVKSVASQAHPLGAVSPVAPFIVITTVQELAPIVNFPAVAPPTVDVIDVHPVAVNFVPTLTNPDEYTWRNPVAELPQSTLALTGLLLTPMMRLDPVVVSIVRAKFPKRTPLADNCPVEFTLNTEAAPFKW